MELNLKAGEEQLATDLAAWLYGSGQRKLIIVMGLPACGKSTLSEWLEKLGAKRINRDAIRKRLYGDEGTMGDVAKVNSEYYRELREALALGGVVVSDNVNITKAHRRGTIEAALEAGYTDVCVVWVDVPLDVCLERNRKRDRHVGEDVIRSMHESLQKDGEPGLNEGRLVVLNSGKDREHYFLKQVREGDKVSVPPSTGSSRSTPAAPAPSEPANPKVDKGVQRAKFLDDLQVQCDLLRACAAANRTSWAAETLAIVREMTDSGISLFVDSPADGGKSGPPTKKPWVPPTPEQVTETLLKMIGGRPLAGGDGPLIVLSFNGHLLTKEKAEHLLVPLLELVKRAHIVFFQETNVDAVRVIARAAHYGLNASHRNERQQACAFVFHPRLQWLGKAPIYHDYLCDVPQHPEYKATLRPALQRRLRDLSTGAIFDVVNFHGKSNLGGPDETRPVRRWQFEALVAELEKQKVKSPYEPRPETSKLVDNTGYDLPLGPVILGGDYNAPIENAATTEIQPLENAGFVRVSTADNRWSYQYRGNGGQFDGFFVRGLDSVKECFIPPFFPAENKRDNAFYRELSDHLPVFAVIDLPVVKKQEEAPASTPVPDAAAAEQPANA